MVAILNRGRPEHRRPGRLHALDAGGARWRRGHCLTPCWQPRPTPTRNANGDTALRLAAFRGSLPMVEKLVGPCAARHARLDPLIYAAFNGHAPVVTYLLDHGAKVDAQADNGFTALIGRGAGGHEAVVKELLKQGANPNLKSDAGDTAIDFALRANNDKIFELLRRCWRFERSGGHAARAKVTSRSLDPENTLEMHGKYLDRK